MKPWHFAVLLLAGQVCASGASAKVPNPANSTLPRSIVLVGSTGDVPDASLGQFTIVLRDVANNPLPFYTVMIDLSNCADLALCHDQRDPAASVDCPAKVVRKLTDANGAVTFTVMGGSNGAGNATTFLNGGRIYAEGVWVATPTVACYDLDGTAGVGANDLSAWLADFATGEPYGRCDYDGDGVLGANDLSFWLGAFGAGGSTSSCTTACP
jgi:hypothetical protein